MLSLRTIIKLYPVCTIPTLRVSLGAAECCRFVIWARSQVPVLEIDSQSTGVSHFVVVKLRISTLPRFPLMGASLHWMLSMQYPAASGSREGMSPVLVCCRLTYLAFARGLFHDLNPWPDTNSNFNCCHKTVSF